MDWQQFVMNLDTLNPASVEEILVRHGAQSVTFSDAGDLPVLEPGPGETPLWSHTRVTGLFDADADMAKLLEDLTSSHDPDQAMVTSLGQEKEINAFFRLTNPTVIARLREAFSDLSDEPTPKEVFVKLRELRNQW